MNIVDTATGRKHEVEISPIEDINFKTLGKGGYFFDWNLERKYEVLKLRIEGSSEILGLISLERIPSEWRVHNRLLTVSNENQGKGKKYDSRKFNSACRKTSNSRLCRISVCFT